MHVHPLAYVCITYENTKVKSPGENQNVPAWYVNMAAVSMFWNTDIAAIYDGEGSQFFCFV